MNNIRKHFPVLMHHEKLSYLDSAATTHKPQSVIEAERSFYMQQYASVHRGIYDMAEQATMLYEQARATVAQFINAHPHEVVFTRGTTESINAVAMSWALRTLKPGDEILVTELEHHANFLPWQQLAHEYGIKLVVLPVAPDGTLLLEVLPRLVTQKTKLFAVTHTSNALGTRNDLEVLVGSARSIGARVLLDAAQAVAHEQLDVKALGVDFVAFSGHKMFGPTGIGVLYVHEHMHDHVPPYQLGGSMVHEVGLYESSWRGMPHRLEAGTPPIAQAIGLASACTFMRDVINYAWLREHEALLIDTMIQGLQAIESIRILGPLEQLRSQGHLVSFVVKNIHAHDVASYLNRHGIAVRAGHHCAQPLSQRLSYQASVRVSCAAYTTLDDIERCIARLQELVRL